MEVKVLSRETIIPSSPTPPHLKTFELSLQDQLAPMHYIPLLIFYPMKRDDDIGHHNSKKAIATLKTSLSETLSRFFLLAGRIVDKSIRCSDEGAIFIEASVSCNMSDILKEPNNEVLMKLLPCSVLCTGPVEEYAQVIVQANIFSCGGIAISLCLLHKLIDITTLSLFLRSWAASSNKESSDDSSLKMVCSDYKAFSSLFPQALSLPLHPQVHKSISPSSDRKRCIRRYVFENKAILALKAKAKSIDVPNPTCVEVLTAFVWKCAMKASSTRNGSQRRPSTLCHVVNLRKRIEPPLAEGSVGNILWATACHYSANEIEIEVEISELVGLLKQSFAKINNEQIKGFMGEKGARGILELLGDLNKFPSEFPNNYYCTSWRNMNLNEADFGWGKPVWIGIAGDSNEIMEANVIYFLDTALGDGVEVWMILDQKEMDLLEQNPQFLEFALVNPSIQLP